MSRSFDDYVEPLSYGQICKKVWDIVYTAHYSSEVDDEELPRLQVVTGALIAAMLEKLASKDEEPRIVRRVDDCRSLATEPTVCFLLCATSTGIKGKRFKTTKSEWDTSIAFNVRENFFDLDPDEIPLLVARCRYTLSDKQIKYFMKTETGRRKMLQEYCEVLYVVTGDDGERTVKPEARLTDEEKIFFGRYKAELYGKDED